MAALTPRQSVQRGVTELEGSPKMDRVRLAKEKRNDKEKSVVDLEEALLEKERRAQLQLERSAKERARRLDEQRQREELRRAAVEEKRRQQLQDEKERLEALTRRRAQEKNLQMEQRPKRWTWGGQPDPPDECDFPTPPILDPPLSKHLSSSSAGLVQSPERACPSPHRSPYRGSPNRKSNAGPHEPPEESRGFQKHYQIDKHGVERSPVPTLTDPVKHLESPTTPTRCSPRAQNRGFGTPKRVRSSKNRPQSPCSPGQYPTSPMKHRATTPIGDSNRRWEGEEKGSLESKGNNTLEKKSSKAETSERKIPKSSSRDLGTERSAESPSTPTGKHIAGTTDADEACRLLAERRRLARLQKELEDRQRLEDERLRLEELQKKQEEAWEREQAEARQEEEDRQRRERERIKKEEEDRSQKERRWKEMQDQLDREREEAFLRAQREAERKHQEREQLKLKEEEERLLRKKRIEEIMKRTRRSDSEPRREEGTPEHPSPISTPLLEPTGTVQVNGQVNDQALEILTALPPLSTPVEPPPIILGLLETKSCGGEELSDGVQSMDVSPVSRDELASIPEFSPTSEQNSVSNALEELQDLTGEEQGEYPKLTEQPPIPKLLPAAALGDCNKNLIERFSIPAPDSQMFQSLGPSPGKLDIQ